MWIIPVPGPVESVSEGDEATFDELAQATAPPVQWDNPKNDDDGGNIGTAWHLRRRRRQG